MNIFNAVFQQAKVFLKLADFRGYIFILVVKYERDKIIISYVPCFSEVPAFIDQDTQFTHETIPQKMTGNSSRLR